MSLPVDGVYDNELQIKGLPHLQMGDWRSEDDLELEEDTAIELENCPELENLEYDHRI